MPLSKNTNIVVVPATKTSQETNDIRPIKPPEELPAEWGWVWWVLLLAALAAVSVFLFRKYRKKKEIHAIEVVIPPHVKARQRIEQAKKYLGDPRMFCFEISSALRVYLEERFYLRAPERTTEEFLSDLQGTRVLTDAQKELLAQFLLNCDLVKFARQEPTEQDLLNLQESALKLVDETAPYGEQTVKQEHVGA